MGSSRLISKEKSKVESISLTQTFEELCPVYMSFGMSYDEFWHDDVWKAKFYRECHYIKIKQKNEELWLQGMYIYEALCDVSPILHAFSKNGTKPLPYSNKPYPIKDEESENTKTDEEKEQEKKQAELIARIHFDNWARMVKKQFENKKR